MQDRRVQPRLLCADLVDVRWKDKSGRTRKAIANLEDISAAGACLQLDHAVPLQTLVQMDFPKGQLLGRVRYCVYREFGYFLGVEFAPGCKWTQRQFRPQHLLDPRRLVGGSTGRSSSSSARQS